MVEYKKLEDGKTALVLPCELGKTVWVIEAPYCEHGVMYEPPVEGKGFIEPRKFTLSLLEQYGVTVFNDLYAAGDALLKRIKEYNEKTGRG